MHDRAATNVLCNVIHDTLKGFVINFFPLVFVLLSKTLTLGVAARTKTSEIRSFSNILSITMWSSTSFLFFFVGLACLKPAVSSPYHSVDYSSWWNYGDVYDWGQGCQDDVGGYTGEGKSQVSSSRVFLHVAFSPPGLVPEDREVHAHPRSGV